MKQSTLSICAVVLQHRSGRGQQPFQKQVPRHDVGECLGDGRDVALEELAFPKVDEGIVQVEENGLEHR